MVKVDRNQIEYDKWYKTETETIYYSCIYIPIGLYSWEYTLNRTNENAYVGIWNVYMYRYITENKK